MNSYENIEILKHIWHLTLFPFHRIKSVNTESNERFILNHIYPHTWIVIGFLNYVKIDLFLSLFCRVFLYLDA